MKPKFFILPVVALVLVASWIGRERLGISALERKGADLKTRLAARSTDIGADAASTKGNGPGQLTKKNAPIDWKKMAGQIEEMESGDDIRKYILLQRKILALSKEELICAYDEIATLDLPDEARASFQRLLFDQLREKDPELALTRCLDQLDAKDGRMLWELTRAMSSWADKNPAAATVWFDQQIAAGKFDSKSLDGENPVRMQFESVLLGALLSKDLAAAVGRLRSLPEDQRLETVFAIDFEKGEDHLAYAKLIRDGLPQAAQAQIFAGHATQMIRQGYPAVTEYLDRIKATPTERAVCVEQAARLKIHQLSEDKKVSREEIDTLREWVASQVPGTVENLTGRVIGQAMGAKEKLNFPEAAALATQYHAASGNDEVLIGFLDSCDLKQQPNDEVRALIAEISDAKKRADFLGRLN